MSDNPLQMPAAGAQAPSAPPAPASRPPTLDEALKGLVEARHRMDVVREQLDHLMKLGDMVKPEDVVESAGKAVAEGVSPEGMAAMLSEMPEQPEQLAEWIAQHDQEIRVKEQQLTEVTQVVSHKLAVQGFRQLMQHGPQAESISGPQTYSPQVPNVSQEAQAAAPPPSNALMPGGSSNA